MTILRTPIFRIYQCEAPDPNNPERTRVYAEARIEHREIGIVTNR